jgi:pimeloyl-ACP methyl ester carboxylesterase
METVILDEVTLECEVTGAGEPLLLIGHLMADPFRVFLSEPALADRYQLIRYHRRGWSGSTHTPAPVSVRTHVADAVALLDRLDILRAHVAGHSSGAAVALQLALDHPERVETLVLLEPTLLSLPAEQAFVAQAEPVLELLARGQKADAIAMFLSAASGLDWPECRALLDRTLPGAVAAAIEAGDTFFGIELPALAEWEFNPEQAAAIDKPVLSVLGAETQPPWVAMAEFLRRNMPRLEEVTIDGAGHLLQIQRPEPVSRAMADFLARARVPVA